MKRTNKLPSATTLAIGAVAAVGLTVASASSGHDGPEDEGADTPISGESLQQASDAALAYTGEGRVTGTEVDDEESRYEIEVTLDNGDEV
ncbi:MAG: hypothetical protein M3431_09610, partial [Actinomycetota bacterium]|nr:hypothetical protein [Actinomycetota bacterium]